MPARAGNLVTVKRVQDKIKSASVYKQAFLPWLEARKIRFTNPNQNKRLSASHVNRANLHIYNRFIKNVERGLAEQAVREKSANIIQGLYTKKQARKQANFYKNNVTLKRLRGFLETNAFIRDLNLNPNDPFVLTLTSTTVSDVVFVQQFNNWYHFLNWWTNIQMNPTNRKKSGSDTEDEWDDFNKINRNLMQTFTVQIQPVSGGCMRDSAKQRIEKGDTYTFKLVNIKSCDNNCGLECIKVLAKKSFSCVAEKKELGLGKKDKLTPDHFTKVYSKYVDEDEKKTLVFVDKTYAGNDCTDDKTFVYISNGHFSLVESMTSKLEQATKKKSSQVIKHELLAFDFETRTTEPLCNSSEVHKNIEYTTKMQTFKMTDTICSYAYYNNMAQNKKKGTIDKGTFTRNHNTSSARQFLDWLIAKSRQNKHFRCLAHNGANFDFLLLLSAMTSEELALAEPRYRGLSVITFKFCGHEFKDTRLFLTTSLENLCKAYKVDVAKLTSNIYKGMDNKQLCFYKPDLSADDFLKLEATEPEFWTQYKRYCEVDCISLLHVWIQFVEVMEIIIQKMGESTNSDGRWLMKKCHPNTSMTVGGLAKKCFLNLNKTNKCMPYYDEFIQDNPQKYNFIEQFKRGGISFVQYKGKHDKNISVIDIVSQYPCAFMKMKIPIGYSHFIPAQNYITVDEFNKKYYDYHGFYVVKNLKFAEDGLFRPIAMSFKKKSLDWQVNWSENSEYELPIDSEMLKWLIENDGLYQFDLVKGLVSTKYLTGDAFFKKYVVPLFTEKRRQDTLKGTAEYNDALRDVCKLMLNSMSGKLVENLAKYFSLTYVPKADKPDGAYRKINDVVFEKVFDQGQINPLLVMGCMVYSYSKRNLFTYIHKLPNKSKDVIGCETDSIFVYEENARYLRKQCTQTSEDWDTVEYPCYYGKELGCMDTDLTTNGPSYILEKKIYYMPYQKDGKQLHKYRCKGMPPKTIDKSGTEICLLTPEFYKELYETRCVERAFRSVYKVSEGRVGVGSLLTKRKLKASVEYKNYQ